MGEKNTLAFGGTLSFHNFFRKLLQLRHSSRTIVETDNFKNEFMIFEKMISQGLLNLLIFPLNGSLVSPDFVNVTTFKLPNEVY